jgi:DNA polymerase-3 subunit chi
VTEVEFHTGVADPLAFACRLLRKAYRKGARVVVSAPAPLLAQLDRDLWTFDERDFVPHLRLAGGASAALAARTPIWLVEGPAPADAPDVLVNLGGAVPADPERFARVIEVVATEPEQAQAGRQRWRDYLAHGLKPTNHPARAASE